MSKIWWIVGGIAAVAGTIFLVKKGKEMNDERNKDIEARDNFMALSDYAMKQSESQKKKLASDSALGGAVGPDGKPVEWMS